MELPVRVVDDLRGGAAASVPVRPEGYRFRPSASGVTGGDGRQRRTGGPTVPRVVPGSARCSGSGGARRHPGMFSIRRPGSCGESAAVVLGSEGCHVLVPRLTGHRRPARVGAS